MTDPRPLLPPSLARRYADPVEIGRGGMGVVLRARDRELDRPVAIKLLMDVEFGGGSLRERFLEEGRIGSRLEHPNLVRLYDFGVPEDGPPFLVFEFVEGESLEGRLERQPLSGEEALGVLVDIGKGLAHAHDAGVVHRDLKPENILLDSSGRARVADFGLAKDPKAQVQTVQGMLVGTPPYMAPEYIRGKPTGPPADQYALGILAYQLFCGVVPFDAEDAGETLRMHVQAPVPDLTRAVPSLPRDLGRWIQRCLAKDPAERFPHVRDFVERLESQKERLTRSMGAYLPPRPGTSAHDRATRLARAGPKEVRSGPLLVGALGLAVLAGFVFWLRRPAGIQVRDLRVQAAPSSALVSWRATGPTSLDLEGATHDAAPPRFAAGRVSAPLEGLEPGREYAVSVRSDAGAALQRVVFETPEEGDPPVAEARIQGGTVTLELRARYPVRLELEGVAYRAGGWEPLEFESGPLTEEHSLVLPGIEPTTPVRLRARLLPAGSEQGTDLLISDGEALAAVRIRQLLGPSGLSSEAMGTVLDGVTDELRAAGDHPPDVVPMLAAHGVPEELLELLRFLPDLMRDDAVPLELRLLLERRLRPLAGVDLILEGFGHPRFLKLAALRRAILPFSSRTTLPGATRPLGPAWVPPQGKRSRVLMTEAFLRNYQNQPPLGFGAIHHVDPEEIQRFRRDRGQVQLELDVDVTVERQDPVELWLTTRRMISRHWLELRIEDRDPLVLWYAGESDRLEVTGETNQLSCYRLPPGVVRRGRLLLTFRIRTYPGEGAAVVPVSLARVELRGIAP